MNSVDHAAVIAELFENAPQPETDKEIDDALRAFGYDPDEVGRKGETTARLALEGVRLRGLNKELVSALQTHQALSDHVSGCARCSVGVQCATEVKLFSDAEIQRQTALKRARGETQ